MYNELLSYFKMKYFQPFGNFDYHIDSSHLFFVSQRWAGMERIQPAKPSHGHSERCQVRRPDDICVFFNFV